MHERCRKLGCQSVCKAGRVGPAASSRLLAHRTLPASHAPSARRPGPGSWPADATITPLCPAHLQGCFSLAVGLQVHDQLLVAAGACACPSCAVRGGLPAGGPPELPSQITCLLLSSLHLLLQEAALLLCCSSLHRVEAWIGVPDAGQMPAAWLNTVHPLCSFS